MSVSVVGESVSVCVVGERVSVIVVGGGTTVAVVGESSATTARVGRSFSLNTRLLPCLTLLHSNPVMHPQSGSPIDLYRLQ